MVIFLARRDPEVGRPQWKSLWAAFWGWCLDSMDTMLLAIALPVLIEQWHLSTGTAGVISSFSILGMMLGGIGFGILGDYFGRVRMLMVSILVYAFFAAVAAFTQNAVQLGAVRFFMGLGLGGEWGLGASLVSEYWPSRHRAKATSWVHSGYPVGYALASALGGLVLPTLGWRVLFLLGVLPALVVFWIRRNVSEPEGWAERRTKRIDGHTTRNFTLFTLFTPLYIRRTVLAGLLLFLNLAAYWASSSWIPTFLVKTHHFSVSTASWFLIVLNLGGFCGHQVFGILSDKFSRRLTLALGQLGSIVMVVLYMTIGHPVVLFLVGILFGFMIYGYWGTFGTYLSELYPTRLRATGVGFTYNIGRLGGAIAPAVVGVMAESIPLNYAVLIFGAIAYALGTLVVFLIPRYKEDLVGDPGAGTLAVALAGAAGRNMSREE